MALVKFTGKEKDIHEAGDDGAPIHCPECGEWAGQTLTTKDDVYFCECEECPKTFYQYYYEEEEETEEEEELEEEEDELEEQEED